MEKPYTCGKGLAAHAGIPLSFADVLSRIAENLELHISALLDDDAARRERRAYESLVAKHRDVAAHLADLSGEMAAYRDLPMGGHDVAALSTPAALQAFERYVTTKRATIALLKSSDERDEQMLSMMRAATQKS